LDVNGHVVKLTFLNEWDLIPGSINPPDICEGNNMKIATPIDLMASKLLALRNRSEPKDYADIAEMVRQGIPLQLGFEAAYAVSRLSRHWTRELRLDKIQNLLFENKEVEQIVAASPDAAIAAKAREIAAALLKAVLKVSSLQAKHTGMKAYPCIERNASQEKTG